MKFRGRSSIAAEDKVVSTAVAKKQWFLKDLTGLPSLKAGWNGATFYAVKDLDRLALKVHGPEALAKKKLLTVLKMYISLVNNQTQTVD